MGALDGRVSVDSLLSFFRYCLRYSLVFFLMASKCLVSQDGLLSVPSVLVSINNYSTNYLYVLAWLT